MNAIMWKTPAGEFRGVSAPGCSEILGIRYATSERFADPVAYSYPAGVHDCTRPAPYGTQFDSPVERALIGVEYDEFEQVEDPQYLSLTVPDGAEAGEPLPVMVWFHGGGYMNGGCDAPAYNRKLLATEQDVIVVGVNYRLGVLGFVRDRSGSPANLGVLDAIEALRWVKRNIAAFGGNPDLVTIFGESAGADLVRSLLAAEGVDGLFHRAIMQSTPLGSTFNRTKKAKKQREKLAEMPIDAPVDVVKKTQLDILKNVRTIGLAQFLPFAPTFGFPPLAGREEEKDTIAEKAPKVALLAGYNTRETAAFIETIGFLKRWAHRPVTGPLVALAGKIIGTLIFAAPTKKYVRTYAELGGKAAMYELSWRENNAELGACHGIDLMALFGAEGIKDRPIMMGLTSEQIRERGKPVREMWANFAKTGDLDRTEVPGVLTAHTL